jgi:hypothetical protein
MNAQVRVWIICLRQECEGIGFNFFECVQLEVFRKTLVQSLQEDEESSVSYPTDLFWMMNNVLSLLLQENCCERMYGGFRVMLIWFCGRQELHRSLPSLHQMVCVLLFVDEFKAFKMLSFPTGVLLTIG